MKNLPSICVLFLFNFFYCHREVDSIDNSIVLSHNDYAQASPFTNAYNLEVGYIEADIYLRGGSLLVAHDSNEIDPGRTLRNSYLDPVSEKIKSNAGTIYPDATKSMVLMIDLKTNGEQTIPYLIQLLISYPNLINKKNNLKIVLSGSVPASTNWDQYPDYIWFDGRPTNTYDVHSLKRIAFISTNFKNYSKWDGKDSISKEDDDKILALIDQVHAINKPLRFWATPDTENAWAYLLKRNVDILGTDKVSELCVWLANN
jgi:alkaline phosphatase